MRVRSPDALPLGVLLLQLLDTSTQGRNRFCIRRRGEWWVTHDCIGADGIGSDPEPLTAACFRLLVLHLMAKDTWQPDGNVHL